MTETIMADTINTRSVVQRRLFLVNVIAEERGVTHKVSADSFVDARIKYHAALVARDAGLIHHVWVTMQWETIFGGNAEDCTDWMGDDQR